MWEAATTVNTLAKSNEATESVRPAESSVKKRTFVKDRGKDSVSENMSGVEGG